MSYTTSTRRWTKTMLRLTLFAVVVGQAFSGHAAEKIPAGLTLESLEINPARVELQQKSDVAQLLITGWLESGEQIDVTRMVKLVDQPAFVEVTEQRAIRPLADGQQQLRFEINGLSAEVDVEVKGMDTEREISFVQDVAPVLSKMGCNQGTCHGSKDGQNGFKLSLRGYDFLYDHLALTDDIRARRFNRANPDQSLMLLKASGGVAHVGGVLTRPGDREYELLRQWILDGAKLDLEKPRVTSIELLPKNPILPRANLLQQMLVIATYSDGTVRDVTSDAFIESGNIEVLSAEPSGIVTTLRRGESPILARFEGAYTATTITVMGDRSGFVWEQPTTYNYVDELVYSKLERMKILPSGVCTDADFVRRVYLDLTGLPPRASEVREFLNDPTESRQKRAALIDKLIGSREYVEHWTNKWADLLQVNRKHLGEVGAAALRDWIKESIASNQPYDEFAYDVITATGSNLDNPAAAYWKILRDPALAMENTTHLFLAVRFNCNKCHDHPFERWTQDQYYNLTAYFAQVGRKEDPLFNGQKIGGSAVESAAPLVEVVFDSGNGETKHDRTGEIVAPSFPYTHEFSNEGEDPRRVQLGRWITSENNRYFAKSYVNRLWGYLLGTGLIEPIDDIRAGNPPTNPELLDQMTQEFIDSGFDTQHILRTICNSRTYQHSVAANRWNEDDAINYSHATPRRLPAEVLYDAIHVAAGRVTSIPGVPKGFRAAELPDAGVKLPFLDDFGRPARESSCECERSSGVVLGPIMKLVNGPTVNDAISSSDSELAQLVANESDDHQLIEEVFLRFLARKPTEQEVALGVEALSAAKDDGQQYQDKFDQYRADLLAKQDDWEKGLAVAPQWTVVTPENIESTAKATFEILEDQSVLVSGNLAKDTYQLKLSSPVNKLTGLKIELLPDESLGSGGPGRAMNGNLVLSELKLGLLDEESQKSQPIALQNATASFSQSSWNVTGAIDGNPGTGWGIMPQVNKANEGTFETAEDIEIGADQRLQLEIDQQYDDGKHNLGRFRVSFTDSRRPFAPQQLPEEIAPIVATPKSERSPEQLQKLQDYYLSLDKPLQELQASLQQAQQQALQHRLTGVQDLAWALINNPSFLFNR